MRFCPNRHGTFAEQADVCPDCGERLLDDRRGSEVVPGVRVERLLGRGGMHTSVWEATRLADGQLVALKIADPDADLSERTRLAASASLMAGLRHPALAAVHTSGTTASGATYVVMDLLKGRTLLQLLDQKRSLALGVAAHVAREVLSGLAVMHAHGIVHRDVKPSNIHIMPRGAGEPWEVKLLDVGVARRFTPGEVPASLDVVRGQPGQWGRVIGTPEYMAPEQIVGVGADPRSDLYALGIVLQRLLTGVHPVVGADRHALFETHLRGTLAPLEMPDGFPPPPGLALVIARATAKQPGARYRNANEMRAALTAY
ncbi:MAG: serine/threonine-protein kinase [Myxococcota bacterium]